MGTFSIKIAKTRDIAYGKIKDINKKRLRPIAFKCPFFAFLSFPFHSHKPN